MHAHAHVCTHVHILHIYAINKYIRKERREEKAKMAVRDRDRQTRVSTSSGSHDEWEIIAITLTPIPNCLSIILENFNYHAFLKYCRKQGQH